MAKKRNCKRSENEIRNHDIAVKIRKMTDEQLVKYLESIEEKAREETQIKKPAIDIDSIVEKIGNIKGIGRARLSEIENALKEMTL